jgi:hypothetical protein
VLVVERGRRWCNGGGGNDGWRWVWCFGGVWEKKNGDGGGEWLYGGVKAGSDLKIGHVGGKNVRRCVRTHLC